MNTHLLNSVNFFNLENYCHASLFEGCEYIWQALENLKPYLFKQKLGIIETTVPAGVYLIDSHLISIGEGTILEPGAYIKGPCIIGKNCTVRHGAYIRGDFISGDDCVIGHDTEIKHSIFLNHVAAAHFAYVGDSILGNHVNLGAGTICANLKLDRSEIILQIGEEKIFSKRKKLGAILGDGAQTGCNSVLNPGTIFGKKSFCYPSVNVGGVIPEKSVVKSTQQTIIIPMVKNKL